jgi:SAM-dependent MidA family methyltransferase
MVQWIRTTARKLTNGFLLLIDYGHEGKELYSETHSSGTLTTYCQQRVFNETLSNTPAWLVEPGSRDITAHVDLTAVRESAEREGLLTLGVLDQTYFLLGLGAANYVSSGSHISQLKQRLSLKSLLIPGGIGSTHKVLVFSAGISPVKLAGCSYNLRTT